MCWVGQVSLANFRVCSTEAKVLGFTGRIEWVRIDRADDGHDHLLDPEHVLHFAMSRQ